MISLEKEIKNNTADRDFIRLCVCVCTQCKTV